MLKHFCFFFLLGFSIVGYAQVKKELGNAIGISTPIIWNNSNGIYYGTGDRREPSGKAISYGVNVNFTKTLYKNWLFIVGAGYFKQSFNIIRPFEFDGDIVTNLGYSTKNYNYHCFHVNAGIGYKYNINKTFSINGLVTYNLLHSFKQKYIPVGLSGSQHKPTQTNTKNMDIGYFINFSVGVEKMLTKKISIGADVVFPIITKWKNDEIFYKSPWGDDSQIIAENKFSIGTVISCKYHF